MAIDVLIKINGNSIRRMIKSYKVDENLLWADSDRAMDGSIHATRIGEFPKIEIVFKDGLRQDEVQYLGGLMNAPFFNVEYFRPRTGRMETMQFYRNDYSLELLDQNRQLYKSFSVNLIPTRRS